MKIPVPVWAAFTTGRPELLLPLRAAVGKGELLTQEEQLGLLEALSEAVEQACANDRRNQAVLSRLQNYGRHIGGGQKLLDSLQAAISGNVSLTELFE